MKGTMEGFLVRGFVIAGMCAGLVFATTPVFASGSYGQDTVHSSDHKGKKGHDKDHDDHGKDHKDDGHHGKKGSH